MISSLLKVIYEDIPSYAKEAGVETPYNVTKTKPELQTRADELLVAIVKRFSEIEQKQVAGTERLIEHLYGMAGLAWFHRPYSALPVICKAGKYYHPTCYEQLFPKSVMTKGE